MNIWLINVALCVALLLLIGYVFKLKLDVRREISKAKAIVKECGLLRNKYYEWLTEMDEWEEEEELE